MDGGEISKEFIKDLGIDKNDKEKIDKLIDYYTKCGKEIAKIIIENIKEEWEVREDETFKKCI